MTSVASEKTVPVGTRSGDADRPPVRTGVTVAVLAITGIVVSLAQTLVVPIIQHLPAIFHTTAADAGWIITVTLLVGAVSTPVIGRLGDLFGKRLMLLIAIVPFIVGSAICAVAVDLGSMIVGRALQGIATGMVPLGISLLHDLLPKHRAGAAIALMSSSMGIGGALGLPIAAAVTQYADWRVLFWATAACAAAAFVAILILIPARRPQTRAGGFDWIGTIGLAIGLVALLLGISKGGDWGWASAPTIGTLALAVVVLGLWGWYELRHRAPLVDLRTTVRPVVLLTNVASILIGFAMYALNLILPQVLQSPVELGYGLGLPMLGMGLCMVPMGLAMASVSKLGAGLSQRRGPKVTLALSGILVAIGYASAMVVLATIGNRAAGPADTSQIAWTVALLVVSATVVGGGIGFAFGAMPALIMSSVPASEKAAANGFNSLMRSIGTTASAAVIGVVLAQLTQQMGGAVVPTVGAFIVSLAIGAAGALVASILAAVIPGNPGRGERSGH